MSSAVHHCKECNVYFESSKSLDVHLHYHKDNLLSKWASQAASSSEHNNNNTSLNHNKDELTRYSPTSSGGMKSSTCLPPGRPPSYPPTSNGTNPAAYPDTRGYSPNFNYASSGENGPSTNSSAFSPVPSTPMLPPPPSNEMRSPTSNGYYAMEQDSASAVSYPTPDSQYTNGSGSNMRAVTPSGMQSPSSTTGQQYRYHPYNNAAAMYQQQQSTYSHHQCEKCGCFCDNSTALLEHIAVCPSRSRSPPMVSSSTAPQYMDNNYFEPPAPTTRVKTEHEAAEILDLDSHKVHVYQPPLETKQGGGRLPPPHFAPAPQRQPPVPVAMVANMHTVQQQQNEKIYQQHQQQQPINPSDYNTVVPVTTTPDISRIVYTPMHHMYHDNHLIPHIPVPQIPPQTHNVAPPLPPAGPPSGSSSGNQSWKSNEARRPKTYNCSACNKWFTSSGHLKRHYNTTLHKNAVKQGAPDPGKEVPTRGAPPSGNDSSSTTTPSPAPSLGEESSSRSDDNASFGRTTPAASMLPPNAAGSPPNRQAGLLEAPTLAASGETTPGGLQHPLSHFSPNHISNHPSNNTPNSIIHNSNNSSSIGNAIQQRQQTLMVHQELLIQRGILSGPVIHNNNSNNNMGQTTTRTSNTFDLFELHNNSLPPPNAPLPGFGQFHDFITPGGAAISPSSIAMQFGPFTSMHHSHQFPSTFIGPEAILEQHQTQHWFHHHPAAMSPMLASSPHTIGHSENSSSLEGAGDMDHHHVTTTHIKEEVQQQQQRHHRTPSRRSRGRGGARGSRTPKQTVSSSILSNGTHTTIHKCLDCDKVFNKACYLTQHNKSFHSGDKPFKCNTCGKRFTADYLYQEHLGKHAGDKPYKCEVCPKQFNHKTDLRRHMCLHTGDKPYSCQVCGKGFIRKDHMLKHCETHRRKQLQTQQQQ